MNKTNLFLTLLGVGVLTACTTATSSSGLLSSESPSETSSEVSSEDPVEKTLEISRETWPLLTYDPYVPTRAFFNNLQFRYFGASDEPDGQITDAINGNSASFYMYNVDAIDNIEKITVTLAKNKTQKNFEMFAATDIVGPELDEFKVPYTQTAALVYEYDFSGLNVNHFRFKNGLYTLMIKSIVLTISSSFEFPDAISTGGGEQLPDTGDGFYKLESPTITRDDFKWMTGSALDGGAMPHVGNVNLLIVPVNFLDFNCGAQDICDARRDKLEQSFFGESEEMEYESVASYYEKSSYGRLNIGGVVTPEFQVGKTAVEWAREVRPTIDPGIQSYYNPTWGLTEDITAWYRAQREVNQVDFPLPIEEFDQNDDGWIDALIMIYNAPSYPNGNYPDDVEDTFWAYCYWNYNMLDFESENDADYPIPFTFFFASHDFMYEGYGTGTVDPHTFIHEMGHILGLQDYYTYDGLNGDWGAAGALDMMDNNVLDHNAYSKFLLEWIEPYVIDNTKQETTLTIQPFESSGDAIIINNGFNGSPYDEYLIIEFYTPTGLNEKHSLTPYPGNGLQGFTIPGLKIYHVDSRIGAYNSETSNFVGFSDEVIRVESEDIEAGATYEYYMITNSNSPSRHRLNGTRGTPEAQYMKLLHLLESNGINTFRDGFDASNDTLFVEGDTFTPLKHFSSFPIFGQFNDGSEIGFEIRVDNITSEGATITFTRFSF
jgi:M6 family metalloprotease-like protein